jgi:hypothetical protein
MQSEQKQFFGYEPYLNGGNPKCHELEIAIISAG